MINLELPDLPYSKDSLMPYMSVETLELHHDKHHMAYVTNGNKFIKENSLNDNSIEEIVKNSYQKNAPIFNNEGNSKAADLSSTVISLPFGPVSVISSPSPSNDILGPIFFKVIPNLASPFSPV